MVFDVDDVLITSIDEILKPQNKESLEELRHDLEKRYSKAELDELYSIIFQGRKKVPVHPDMIKLIAHLQSKGIKVLALTHCITGKFGNIESMEDWRIQEIEKLGYFFNKSWKDLEEKSFEEKDGKQALFKKGVIFTNHLPKGEVLKAFLDYTHLRPKHILFIDDKKKNVQSVQEIARHLDIPYTGIEYKAVEYAKYVPLNKERAKFQFAILEKEHVWLSDEEADKKMKSCNCGKDNK